MRRKLCDREQSDFVVFYIGRVAGAGSSSWLIQLGVEATRKRLVCASIFGVGCCGECGDCSRDCVLRAGASLGWGEGGQKLGADAI